MRYLQSRLCASCHGPVENSTNCIIYYNRFRVEAAITTATQSTWLKLIQLLSNMLLRRSKTRRTFIEVFFFFANTRLIKDTFR